MEENKTADNQKRCLVCKSTSQEKTLLCGEAKGEQVWVCVHCLPMLIHGAH